MSNVTLQFEQLEKQRQEVLAIIEKAKYSRKPKLLLILEWSLNTMIYCIKHNIKILLHVVKR